MATDRAAARSRRSLLAAGLGGLLASVASAVGRPNLVRAGSDGDVVLGGDNHTTNPTGISNSTASAVALSVNAATNGVALLAFSPDGHAIDSSSSTGNAVYATSDSSYGVYAKSTSSYGLYATSTSNAAVYGDATSHPGVIGHSDNTIGVSGISPNGSGVSGSSGIGVGVVGSSNATDQAGIRGSTGGDATGVLGYSGNSLPGSAPAKTGVYGEAAQDSTAKGVWGKSNSGRGVYGQAAGGHGVHAYATTGAAIYAQTAGLKKGLAIRAVGRIKLDNSAGIATITSGTKSVVVTPGIDLQATSAVVATLQGNPGGTTAVQRVEVDAAADTFTIFLTANATSTVSVAWHVFG